MEYSSKKSVLKWVLIYILIGIIAYAGIYFLVYKKDEGKVKSEILVNEGPIAQTYTADNYYFSVLWPSSWQIEKGSMGIVLSGKEGTFNIAWNGLGGMCDEDKITQFTKKENSYWICDLKEDGSYSHATISKVSNKDIAIGIIPSASYSSEDEKWLFLKIIQNIQLDPQGIAGWKTYNNEQYGLTFKYPENFLVQEPQVVASQCAFEGVSEKCNSKIIIDRIQYCYNHHTETGEGIVYHYDSYATIRKYNTLTNNKSDFCLSVSLKTSEGKCGDQNCLSKNEERPKILEKIVPTFKFVK